MNAIHKKFWAAQAWVEGRWQHDVLLEVGADGHWLHVQACQACPEGATRLEGPVIPSLVDTHSHAFQRAMAGLTETTGSAPAAASIPTAPSPRWPAPRSPPTRWPIAFR